MSKLFFVSDIHLTDFVGSGEYAVSDVLGYTQDERVRLLCERVTQSGADEVFILGDLSIDDPPWRRERFGKENYTRKLIENYLKPLGKPLHMIPGNHDSHTNDEWREMTGRDRGFALISSGILFIMLDNFAGTASGASGSPYTKSDVGFIKASLGQNPGRKAIICAHYFDFEKESDEFRELIREDDRIIALAQGHTHVRSLTMRYGKPLYDIGGFSYNCYSSTDANGRIFWDFNHYDEKSAWGYLILDTGTLMTEYVYVKADYNGSNGHFPREEEVIRQSLIPDPT